MSMTFRPRSRSGAARRPRPSTRPRIQTSSSPRSTRRWPSFSRTIHPSRRSRYDLRVLSEGRKRLGILDIVATLAATILLSSLVLGQAAKPDGYLFNDSHFHL